MFSCAKCNQLLRNSGIHRIIRTRTGNLRAAGLCPPCANRHDVQQKKQDLWRIVLGIAGMAALFAGASYVLLHYF